MDILLEVCEIFKESLKDLENYSTVICVNNIYNIKIIFCTKYHCQLNVLKAFGVIKKHMFVHVLIKVLIKLISESSMNFVEGKILLKLFRHFWREIEAYSKD